MTDSELKYLKENLRLCENDMNDLKGEIRKKAHNIYIQSMHEKETCGKTDNGLDIKHPSSYRRMSQTSDSSNSDELNISVVRKPTNRNYVHKDSGIGSCADKLAQPPNLPNKFRSPFN